MHWYCLHTRPAKESLVAQYLDEVIRLECYFPRIRQVKRIRRVRREVISPLFPRYLFCQFDPATHFRAARYAPEVIDIVGANGAPIVVSESIISELQSWAGHEFDILSVRPEMKPGDRVRFADGPMLGFEAIFLHDMSDDERVAVLLANLDLAAKVVTNRKHLEPVT